MIKTQVIGVPAVPADRPFRGLTPDKAERCAQTSFWKDKTWRIVAFGPIPVDALLSRKL